MYGLESYFHDVTRARSESRKCPRKIDLFCTVYSFESVQTQSLKLESARIAESRIRVGSFVLESARMHRQENQTLEESARTV